MEHSIWRVFALRKRTCSDRTKLCPQQRLYYLLLLTVFFFILDISPVEFGYEVL